MTPANIERFLSLFRRSMRREDEIKKKYLEGKRENKKKEISEVKRKRREWTKEIGK